MKLVETPRNIIRSGDFQETGFKITATAKMLDILSARIYQAFLANPGLNGVIVAVLIIGILLSFRQVLRLFPEVRWVNTFRIAEPGLEVERPPVLLAPMATLLGDRIGRMLRFGVFILIPATFT